MSHQINLTTRMCDRCLCLAHEAPRVACRPLSDAAPKPKPSNLREWLGDRVSELGPWAEVLREQPVPAGWIERWEWARDPHEEAGPWLLKAFRRNGVAGLHVRANNVRAQACGKVNGYLEALQMSLFAHHPDVKPEPRPAAIVCEDQYEVTP